MTLGLIYRTHVVRMEFVHIFQILEFISCTYFENTKSNGTPMHKEHISDEELLFIRGLFNNAICSLKTINK
jgi:hypothetical protein